MNRWAVGKNFVKHHWLIKSHSTKSYIYKTLLKKTRHMLKKYLKNLN